MSTSIGNVAVYVADLQRAERFYVDVLGLGVLARISAPEVEEVIVGHSSVGSRLMLARQRDGAVPTGSGLWKVFVETDGLEELFERVAAAGAEVVEVPRRLEQFGVAIALVRDPDGYLVELGQIDARPGAGAKGQTDGVS
jgi:catechol 2,3-dioxygenase-like lactoylglutathione lyase family enzyme